jgi:hypothetical protein
VDAQISAALLHDLAHRYNVRHALPNAGGPTARRGKIVAELLFSFGRYLSSAAHEKTLWVPARHRAFPRGTDRAAHVDGPVGRLHHLRDRVAHHEPLLTTNVAGRLSDLIGIAARLDPSWVSTCAPPTRLPTC